MKLNIYHVTYYCIWGKNGKNWGNFFENFTALKSTLQLAAYILTPEHWLLKSEYRLLFKGSKIFNKKIPYYYYVFPIYKSKLHDICSTSNLVNPYF